MTKKNCLNRFELDDKLKLTEINRNKRKPMRINHRYFEVFVGIGRYFCSFLLFAIHSDSLLSLVVVCRFLRVLQSFNTHLNNLMFLLLSGVPL